MQNATKPQITKIHILLSNIGISDQKAEIVYNLTKGRTESTRNLFINEARALITTLTEFDPKEKKRRLIFSLAYKAGIIYGDTPDDKKMNAAKLNLFLKERGAIKKGLNEMNFKELTATHRQFAAIIKGNEKSTNNKQADKAVKNLLKDLNFQTL